MNEDDRFQREYEKGLRTGWHPLVAACEAQKKVMRKRVKLDSINRQYSGAAA